MGSEFGDLFQYGAEINREMLGDKTATVTYTPPTTKETPNPASQPLTKPIISSLQKTERPETDESGNKISVARSISFKLSEVTRLSNKGFITIDGVSYPMLTYTIDNDSDQVHVELNYPQRTSVSRPNFIRNV